MCAPVQLLCPMRYSVFTANGSRKQYLCTVVCKQEALAERVKLYRTWKDDESNLAKKRELKSRFESSHKTDKLNETNREISEV